MKYACTRCGRTSDHRQCEAHRPNPNAPWSPGRTSTNQSRFARAVKKRDGHKCVRCGATSNLVAHHVVPFAHGGSDDPGNGLTLCDSCHRSI